MLVPRVPSSTVSPPQRSPPAVHARRERACSRPRRQHTQWHTDLRTPFQGPVNHVVKYTKEWKDGTESRHRDNIHRAEKTRRRSLEHVQRCSGKIYAGYVRIYGQLVCFAHWTSPGAKQAFTHTTRVPSEKSKADVYLLSHQVPSAMKSLLEVPTTLSSSTTPENPFTINLYARYKRMSFETYLKLVWPAGSAAMTNPLQWSSTSVEMWRSRD